jgi:hypothetical protein
MAKRVETGAEWKNRQLAGIEQWYDEAARWECECFPPSLRNRTLDPGYLGRLRRLWDAEVPDDDVVVTDWREPAPLKRRKGDWTDVPVTRCPERLPEISK